MHRRSPLAMAALALLCYEPLHPYRMQQLLKQWGKGDVVNVGQRATLYKVIERLDREGLIAVREVLREGQRPERVVYEITAEGRRVVVEWVRAMVASPAPDFPEFPAGMSFVMLLGPDDALAQLECRRADLQAELDRQTEGLRGAVGVPRVALLDSEYQWAVTGTELRWVEGVVDDLRSGRLTWSEDQLRAAARAGEETAGEDAG
ncbi:MAG TPA: PadR family transcriptional regulator [Actinomycetota bacterium]|nr:PadR family transcriptional regulator [Actinomycetota bacterium]